MTDRQAGTTPPTNPPKEFEIEPLELCVVAPEAYSHQMFYHMGGGGGASQGEIPWFPPPISVTVITLHAHVRVGGYVIGAGVHLNVCIYIYVSDPQ